MIPLEAILESAATMIIGILFVATIAETIGARPLRFLWLFSIFGILPFSITAILALLELTEAAKWAAIFSFVLFAVFLTIVMTGGILLEREKERKQKEKKVGKLDGV
jgi:uncharacterized protein YacL